MKIKAVGILAVVVVRQRDDVWQAVLYETNVGNQPAAQNFGRRPRHCPFRVVLDSVSFADPQVLILSNEQLVNNSPFVARTCGPAGMIMCL